MTTEQIAHVVHDANRAYALVIGEDPTKVWPEWGQAPEDIRNSAITGVEQALRGATPEQLHESWCVTKRNDGWTYGEVRDNDAKKHPCLVTYDNLPEDQRRKDALFFNIVATLRR